MDESAELGPFPMGFQSGCVARPDSEEFLLKDMATTGVTFDFSWFEKPVTFTNIRLIISY